MNKEKRKEYRKKNRDRINAQKKISYQKHKATAREWREKNKEKRKEYSKAYLKQNRDRILEQKREYMREYYKNPEIIQKVKAYKRTPAVKARKKIFDKRYYEANKSKVSAHQKLYNKAHKEEQREWHKKYQQEHREELAKHSKEYRDKNMREFISTYKMGKCCELCGYNEYPDILQFHHKKNKSFTISTSRFIKPELLKAEIDKCILLCPNCHFWLHFKEGKK